jgi:enamine deaminase RidA (YjgF/YER057c/UK114 family)
MLRTHSPTTVAPPFSRYSHGIEVPASARWLHISGQVGVAPDGTVRQGAEAQIEQTWRNLLAILESAGMGPRDLVKVTTFDRSCQPADLARGPRTHAAGRRAREHAPDRQWLGARGVAGRDRGDRRRELEPIGLARVGAPWPATIGGRRKVARRPAGPEKLPRCRRRSPALHRGGRRAAGAAAARLCRRRRPQLAPARHHQGVARPIPGDHSRSARSRPERQATRPRRLRPKAGR